jgi:predicted alpha/beta-fold hydrolase
VETMVQIRSAADAARQLRKEDTLAHDATLRIDVPARDITSANFDIAFGRRDAQTVLDDFGLGGYFDSETRVAPLTKEEQEQFNQIVERLRGCSVTNKFEADLYEAGGPENAILALALAVAVAAWVWLWVPLS